MNQKSTIYNADSQLIKLGIDALELLKNGMFLDAQDIFSEIMRLDYSNPTAETGLKTCKYWIPRLSRLTDTNSSGAVAGRQLFDEWKKFEIFTKTIKNINNKVVSSIMHYVFNTALQYLKKDIQDNSIIDIEILFLIGLTYKRIGDFDNAINYFEKTVKIDKDNANAIAQMADCYAMIDEEKKAKILFKEAFFLDPSSIELDKIDCNLMQTLLEKISEYKVPRSELNYWLPVYGRVLEVFNIKRELLPIELGKLRQEIYHIEQEILKTGGNDHLLTARLINNYLWFYDYYLVKNPVDKTVADIENKIKLLSINIYNLLKLKFMQEQK